MKTSKNIWLVGIVIMILSVPIAFTGQLVLWCVVLNLGSILANIVIIPLEKREKSCSTLKS